MITHGGGMITRRSGLITHGGGMFSIVSVCGCVCMSVCQCNYCWTVWDMKKCSSF